MKIFTINLAGHAESQKDPILVVAWAFIHMKFPDLWTAIRQWNGGNSFEALFGTSRDLDLLDPRAWTTDGRLISRDLVGVRKQMSWLHEEMDIENRSEMKTFSVPDDGGTIAFRLGRRHARSSPTSGRLREQNQSW